MIVKRHSYAGSLANKAGQSLDFRGLCTDVRCKAGLWLREQAKQARIGPPFPLVGDQLVQFGQCRD